jgi:hypothetical protein
MNSKIPDDLFSAFLDREATPAEEAEVKARLQASPQAKQELQIISGFPNCSRSFRAARFRRNSPRPSCSGPNARRSFLWTPPGS